MNISDLNYVEDITQEDQLGTVVGGTFSFLGIIPRIINDLFGYQQPTTTVINNIYVENTNTSSSSSGSVAGASSGAPSGSSHH
ncbi:MAG: hypothetical protein PUP92_33225 [Rhizonema sp. PD38]|nr:hypothetical protein [Rhizonema sp. PD38]